MKEIYFSANEAARMLNMTPAHLRVQPCQYLVGANGEVFYGLQALARHFRLTPLTVRRVELAAQSTPH